MLKRWICFLAALFAVGALLEARDSDLPKVPREFRAAWVATVGNIDWPSKKGLTTEEQKAEMIRILDTSVRMNLNALVFQVRPMCDAFYKSDLEPWSEFLTGTMGQAPSPYYDPLEFIIEESHKRGIELHVWFNPYRVATPGSAKQPAPNHVTRQKPEIVRNYGDYKWLDPAEEETKKHTLAVILDVVRRYKVDGVHIDDYFYPYKAYAKGADFPDDAPWERYVASGGKLSRDDWRRSHVNDFVERFYKEVKKENPLVKVGISPFGIWRPGVPEGIHTSFDQYAELYADAKLWLNKGWLDYWTPQLYWPLAAEKQSYTLLMSWWAEQNHQKRHFWPGNYTSRVGTSGTNSWAPEEIINQIEATRAEPGASGNVHFSMIAFLQNRAGLTDKLREGVYAQPALVPASPWLSKSEPGKPTLEIEGTEEKVVSWTAPKNDNVRHWVVYEKKGSGAWSYRFIPAIGAKPSVRIPKASGISEIAVSAVNMSGVEGSVARKRL